MNDKKDYFTDYIDDPYVSQTANKNHTRQQSQVIDYLDPQGQETTGLNYAL